MAVFELGKVGLYWFMLFSRLAVILPDKSQDLCEKMVFWKPSIKNHYFCVQIGRIENYENV